MSTDKYFEVDLKDSIKNKSELNKTSLQVFDKILSIDDAFERVGLVGKYQYLILAHYCLVYLVSAWTFDFLPFIVQTPIFYCEDGNICDEHKACEENYTLGPDQDYNMSVKFGLYCDGRTKRTVLESIPYAGVVTGMTVISYICDNYSRVLSVKVCLFIGLLGNTLLQIAPTNQLWLLYLGFYLMGFGFQTLNIPIAVHLSEITNAHFRQFSIVLIYVVWGTAEIIMLPICLYVAKYQWVMFAAITVPCIISLVLTYIFIEDSPRFTFLKTYKEKAVEGLNKIAKINKTQGIEEHQLEEPYIAPQEKYDYRDLFKYKSQRMKTVWIWGFSVFIHLLFFGTTYSLTSIGKSYEWNIFYIGIIATCGYSMADWVCLRVSRKVTLTLSYGIACLACFCFYFITIPEDCLGYENSCAMKTLQIVLSCLVRFVLTFSFAAYILVCTESYPTKLRSTGYGAAFAVGYIGSFSSPYVVAAAENLGLNPLLSLGVICAAGIFTIFPMKETFKQNLEDDIQEVRQSSYRRESSGYFSKNNSKEELQKK